MSRSKVFIAQRQSQKKSNFVKFSSFDQDSLGDSLLADIAKFI